MVSYPASTLQSSTIQKPNSAKTAQILLMIPTLNEEEAIEDLINEARSAGFMDILVVDGFSTDRTKELAVRAGSKVVLQDFGYGKGCGVRTGMKDFLQESFEVLCVIDGDGTNIPSFLTEMIPVALSGEADVVLGSRTRGPRQQNAMGLLTLASNLTVSFLLGAKFRRLFTDVQTGYWVLTRSAVERIYPKIQATGFEIELELFVTTMKEKLRVSEVPVGFRRRKGSTKFGFMQRIRNLYYAFKLLALR